MSRANGRLLGIYQQLYDAYGPQCWWPGDSPFEVILGAILTQSTAWSNVERAIANLKAAEALSPESVAALSESELARLIRPSGYYKAKARAIKAFIGVLHRHHAGDLDAMLASPADALREALIRTHGIGPETADSILLYAAGYPVFVIDAYTRRTFSRLGVPPDVDTYQSWQRFFMDSLPNEAPLFNEYHALIVRHAKAVCRKRPLCDRCPLVAQCPAAAGAA